MRLPFTKNAILAIQFGHDTANYQMKNDGKTFAEYRICSAY